jgi:hypothetical protein
VIVEVGVLVGVGLDVFVLVGAREGVAVPVGLGSTVAVKVSLGCNNVAVVILTGCAGLHALRKTINSSIYVLIKDDPIRSF